jgi:hypothetical protein
MRRCWETLSKKETVWIIIVVGLGLASAAFAFAAQATRVKAEDISQLLAEEGVCHHPFSLAVAFALISALTLLVAHITLNAVGGCICCARGPNGLVLPHSPTRSIAILCFIFSWYVCVGNRFFFFTHGTETKRDKILLLSNHVVKTMFYFATRLSYLLKKKLCVMVWLCNILISSNVQQDCIPECICLITSWSGSEQSQ